MSSLVQQKGNFYLQVYRPDRTPKKKLVPLKTKDRKSAEKRSILVDELVVLGKMDPWVSTDFERVLRPPTAKRWTFREAVDEFVETKSRTRWTGATRRTYVQVFDQFERHLQEHEPGVRLITDISPGVIARWMESTDANTTSRHKMRRNLSSLFRWMVKHRDLTRPDGSAFDDPAALVELPKLPTKHPKHLPFQEVETILREVHRYQEETKLSNDVRWIVPVVRCNVELGFRASELCDLVWSDVSFEEGVIRSYTSKGKTDRTVPISAYVRGILLGIRADLARHLGTAPEGVPRDGHVFRTSVDAGRINPNHLSRRFKHFARLALPEDRADEVCFHSTRHSAASYLARAGKSAEFIRDYMGHSSISVTQRYMHLNRGEVHAEAVAVFDDLGSAPPGSDHS